MYFDQGTARFGEIKVYVNASHVCFTDKLTGKVFQRGPEMVEWYDEPHKKVVNALDALERAIKEAMD